MEDFDIAEYCAENNGGNIAAKAKDLDYSKKHKNKAGVVKIEFSRPRMRRKTVDQENAQQGPRIPPGESSDDLS